MPPHREFELPDTQSLTMFYRNRTPPPAFSISTNVWLRSRFRSSSIFTNVSPGSGVRRFSIFTNVSPGSESGDSQSLPMFHQDRSPAILNLYQCFSRIGVRRFSIFTNLLSLHKPQNSAFITVSGCPCSNDRSRGQSIPAEDPVDCKANYTRPDSREQHDATIRSTSRESCQAHDLHRVPPPITAPWYRPGPCQRDIPAHRQFQVPGGLQPRLNRAPSRNQYRILRQLRPGPCLFLQLARQ